MKLDQATAAVALQTITHPESETMGAISLIKTMRSFREAVASNDPADRINSKVLRSSLSGSSERGIPQIIDEQEFDQFLEIVRSDSLDVGSLVRMDSIINGITHKISKQIVEDGAKRSK